MCVCDCDLVLSVCFFNVCLCVLHAIVLAFGRGEGVSVFALGACQKVLASGPRHSDTLTYKHKGGFNLPRDTQRRKKYEI